MSGSNLQSTVEGRTLKGFSVGILQFVTNIVYSILLVPLFIEFWGVEKYGIWLLIYSFIMIMRTLDLGHQNYVGNEFNKNLFLDKQKAIYILRSSTWIAFGIGLLEILIFLILDLANLTTGVTGITNLQYLHESKIGIIYFLVVWWMVGSIGGIVARALLPLGYFTHTVILGIALKVLEIIVILIATINDVSILTLCTWLSLSYLIHSLYVFWHVKKLVPELFPLWGSSNIRLGIRNFIKSFFFTVTSTIEQFNLNGIVLMLSGLVSAAVVPAFTTLRTLANLFMQPLMLVLGPLQPELTRFHMQESGHKIEQIVYINWLVNTVMVSLPLILISPFIASLYSFWIKGAIIYDALMFWLLAASVLLINYGRTFVIYLTGINSMRAITMVSIARFILLFSISYLFFIPAGWYSIGIGILFSELVCSIVLPIIYVNKELLRFGTKINSRIAFLSFLPIAINLSLPFGLYYGVPSLLATLVSALLTISICFILWGQLEQEVRVRLVTLIVQKLKLKWK